ncbi:hypothetical protein [Frigidibacter mobilis]|nr:hypothetical protein [Frigidibacter mobilis]
MKMKDNTDTCEARLGGNWEVISVGVALALSPRPELRCIECGGPVRPHKQANNGMRAHFEHRSRHEGCSRGSHFNGRRVPHPDALI